VVIELEDPKFQNLINHLPDGLTIDAQTSFEMVTSTRRDIILVDGSGFKIELFHLSEDAHDQQRFVNRKKLDIRSGWAVFLPTAEDVIIQKLRWCKGGKRQKDFNDVMDVLSVQKDALDFDYITKWCAQHHTLELLAEARTLAEV